MLQWLWKSMISKTEIKMLRSLEKKKGRELYKLILVEGKRLIKQLIESEVVFNKIWATEDFIYKNRDLIKLINSTIEINSISKQDLKKITSTHNPSGIIGVLKPPKGDFKKMNNRIIMLDNIADPGNLGTILRTANWFGMNNILLSDECVDLHNPKVVRSAMGAHFKMNIISDFIVHSRDLLRKCSTEHPQYFSRWRPRSPRYSIPDRLRTHRPPRSPRRRCPRSRAARSRSDAP